MIQIAFSDFKRMNVDGVKASPCLELTADGDHLCFVIIGTQGEMRNIIKSRAGQIDAANGKFGKERPTPVPEHADRAEPYKLLKRTKNLETGDVKYEPVEV